MFKKIAFAAVGLTFLASPLLATAQVAVPQLPANPSLADLQNEIQLLIQILNQLLSQRTHPTTPTYKLSLAFVSGNSGSYTPGQDIHLVMKGVELFDGSAATPEEGLNIQVYMYDSSGNSVPGQGFNATYNYQTSYWEVDLTAPTDTTKTYSVKASLYCSNSTYSCAQRYTDPLRGQVDLSFPFSISGGSSSGITVTAPNGGEQWEEGVLNSITWAPYNYNPDINPSRSVDAFLEQKNPDGSFTNLGSVVPSGKASIHWMTGYADNIPQGGNSYEGFIPPGSGYYIRVVNRETGASDISDAPFTILPKSIDIKVNGSDGPVTVTQQQRVTLSWTASAGYANCYISGSFNGGQPEYLGNNGGPLSVPLDPISGQGIAAVSCTQAPSTDTSDPHPVDTTTVNGMRVMQDMVTLLPSGVQQPQASLQITSPNGAENIRLNSQYNISWHQVGLSSVAIALYKNDQWQSWISKSVVSDKSADDNYSYQWVTPSEAQTGSSVYKIYITGQKADGSGYVDDKSDAPFSFVPQFAETSSPRVIFTSISGTTVNGSYSGLPANSQIVVVNQTSGQTVPGSSYSGGGSGSFLIAGIPSGAFYLRAQDATGTYLAQSVTFYGSGAVTTPTPVSVGTPTCTYGGTTIRIEGGLDACRGWCISNQLESGLPASSASQCSFIDANGAQTMITSNAASAANPNLANALSALTSALKAFLGK